MSEQLRVVMAQLDFLVGDIPGNASRVVEAIGRAKSEHQADIIIFPELPFFPTHNGLLPI